MILEMVVSNFTQKYYFFKNDPWAQFQTNWILG